MSLITDRLEFADHTEAQLRDITLLLSRLAAAFVFLYHGWPKATDSAMASEKFVGMGFPGFLGPIVGWVEVIASILLIVGLWHRLASLTLAVVILVAFLGVQMSKGVVASFERDLLLLAVMLVLVAIGPGRYALEASRGEG